MAEPIFNQPHFQDEDKAREHLEKLRWADGVVCPHCGSVSAHYKLEGNAHRKGLYKCADCREQFTVTVGTVFERSKIKLHIWLQAVHLMCASKKGVSAKQMERMFGVTYKTAWFMSHRIREAMNVKADTPLGSAGGAVEADETYWGNAEKKSKTARGWAHKMKVVSLVERDGEKRSFHVANVTAKNVAPILRGQVAQKARLMTDESKVYTKIGQEFAEHGIVTHSAGEYVRDDITTNTVESSFAILKRALYGTFHHVSEKHLQRYATERDFVWNTRSKLGYSDVDRTEVALKSIGGKRLMYQRTSCLVPAFDGSDS